MHKRLENKVAVVTGSTSGIGAAIARLFAAEGASVVVSGRRKERGEAVASSIRDKGGSATFEPADLTQIADCKRICESAVRHFGGLDILVNNAGIFPRATLEETTPEFFDNVLSINLRGAFFCTQAAVPHMRGRGGGSIINIGSLHPFSGVHDTLAYSISKGGLYTMTRKLAHILRRDRIRVNWITVGWVLTEKEIEVQAAHGRWREDLIEHGKQLPMGEYNTEEDITEACLYLAADSGAHVTGTDLNVSAGLGIRL